MIGLYLPNGARIDIDHANTDSLEDMFRIRDFDTMASWRADHEYKLSSDKQHLIEIRTGEGKSIILACVAALLSFTNHRVFVGCYSQYLSARDAANFKPLFQAMGAQDLVKYGTLKELCENSIKARHATLRADVEWLFSRHKHNSTILPPVQRSANADRPTGVVYLVDEVDALLKRDYFCGLYTPYVLLEVPKAFRYLFWKVMKTKRRSSKIDFVLKQQLNQFFGEDNFPIVQQLIYQMHDDIQNFEQYQARSRGIVDHVNTKSVNSFFNMIAQFWDDFKAADEFWDAVKDTMTTAEATDTAEAVDGDTATSSTTSTMTSTRSGAEPDGKMKQRLAEVLRLPVRCGQFAYSRQLTESFSTTTTSTKKRRRRKKKKQRKKKNSNNGGRNGPIILGATGTLSTLTPLEFECLKAKYGSFILTKLPTVFNVKMKIDFYPEYVFVILRVLGLSCQLLQFFVEVMASLMLL